MQQIEDTEVMSLGWLDEPVQDEPILTPQEEAEADLAEMCRDVTTHLSVPVLRLLRKLDVGWEHGAEVVLSHLVRCDRCRFQLRQSLELSYAPPDHPAYSLMREAEEAIRWNAAGRTATRATQGRLLTEKIGYVYEREGVVYRRLPDGHEEPVAAPDCSPA